MGYIAQQMREYASGARASLDGRRHDSMREIASDITAEEIRVAAEYFAQIRAIK
jgi:cytochrome c553